MIHITDAKTDIIKSYITEEDTIEDVHRQSLQDTLETYDFTVFGDGDYAQFLEKRNRVIIPDEDTGYREFIIEEAVKIRDEEGLKIEVYSVASYLDLKKANVIKPQTLERYTASMAAGFALQGTEWKVGAVEIDSGRYRTFYIENHRNPYSLLKTIANEFDLELRFRIETDGKRVTGRYVDLLERIGEWRGREIEFGRDLLGVKRHEDTSNIVTALVALGPEREDGTRIEAFVEDKEALQRWGRVNPQTGELMHLVEKYEPQSDRTEMTEEELRIHAREELNKRINEVVTYEVDIADLEHVPGLDNKMIRFGDTIKIKDTKFNPPLYLEARVFEQERSIFGQDRKNVKLGDYIEYSEEEILSIWQSLQAQIEMRLRLEDVLDVTYTKEQIDEKDVPGKQAKQKLDNDVGTATIETTDGSQAKADAAEHRAKEYSVAKAIYEAKVAEIEEELADKINSAYFETEMAKKAALETVQQLIEDLKTKAEIEYVDGQLQLKASNEVVEELGKTVSTLQIDLSEKVDGEWVDGRLKVAIDGIEIGGRNLIGKFNLYSWGYGGGIIDQFPKTLSYVVKLERNTDYIVHRKTAEYNNRFWFIFVDKDTDNPEELLGESGVFGPRDNTLLSYSFNSGNYNWLVLYLTNQKDVDDIDKAFIKLEKGTKATDWTPAPEDIFGEIDTKANADNVYVKAEIDDKFDNVVSIEAYQTDKDGFIDRFKSNESRITQNENNIKTKVEQAEYDALEGRVSSAESTIEQHANKIAMKVEQSEFNSLENRVESATKDIAELNVSVNGITADVSSMQQTVGDHGQSIKSMNSSINALSDSITSKVDVETYKTDKNGILQSISNNSSAIQQNADAIKSKVDRTDFNTLSNTVSSHSSSISQHADSIQSLVQSTQTTDEWIKSANTEFKQLNDAISSTVTKTELQGAIDGIQIGVRNLFSPSDTARKRSSEEVTKIAPYSFYATSNWSALSERFIISEGETLTVSFWAKTETEESDILRTQRIGFTTTSGNTRTSVHAYNAENVTKEWKYYEDTFTVADGTESVEFYARTDNGKVWINGLMIVRGNKAPSDWTPAPEDFEAKIVSNSSAISQHEDSIQLLVQSTQSTDQWIKNANSKFTQLNNAISSKVEVSSFNALENKVNSHTTSINQLQNSISSTVTKTELQGAIDGIQIGGRNLVLGSDAFISNGSKSFQFVNDLKDLRGKTVTLSVYIEIENVKYTSDSSSKRKRIGFEPSLRYADGTIQYLGVWLNPKEGDSFKGRLSRTFTIKDKEIEGLGQNSIYVQRLSGDTVKVGRPQVEIGNRATDWTPAPEDFDTRLSAAESTIEQHADSIRSKVEANDVRSIFLQEANSFTFSADQINFNGHVFGGNATFTGKLKGATGTFSGEIETSNLIIDNPRIEDEGTIGLQLQAAEPSMGKTSKDFIRDGYIKFVTTNGGLEISKSQENGSPDNNWYFQSNATANLFAGKIFSVYGGETTIYKDDGWARHFMLQRHGNYNAMWDMNLANGDLNFEYRGIGTTRDRIFRIEKEGGLTLDKGDIELTASGAQRLVSRNGNMTVRAPDGRIYIQHQAGDELRITNGLTTTPNGTAAMGFVDMSRSGNSAGYIGVKSRLRVTDGNFWQGSSGTHYQPINASSFNTSSLEEFKQDITPMEDGALRVICGADLYSYRLKSDVKNGVDHVNYGLVIGEGRNTPQEVIDDEGGAISQYSMTTFAWKAIQELADLQTKQDEEIQWLKTENQLLRNEIQILREALS